VNIVANSSKVTDTAKKSCIEDCRQKEASPTCCCSCREGCQHAPHAASEHEDDESTDIVTAEDKCRGSKRIRKQHFSLAKAVRAITAESDGNYSVVEYGNRQLFY